MHKQVSTKSFVFRIHMPGSLRLLQIHMLSTFQKISARIGPVNIHSRTTQLEFRFDSIVQMPRETRGDQTKVWYKYISEEMIHLLFTLTALAFAFELKIELIGVPIITVGLQGA